MEEFIRDILQRQEKRLRVSIKAGTLVIPKHSLSLLKMLKALYHGNFGIVFVLVQTVPQKI